MMRVVLDVILLLCGAAGFAGSGAAVGMARGREHMEGETDPGMLGVSALLFVFGTFCVVFGSGLLGVIALGGVVWWAAYVVTAQRAGLFEITAGSLEPGLPGKHRQKI